MSGLDLALYIGGSLLVYWAVSVLLDDGGAAARKRRTGQDTHAGAGAGVGTEAVGGTEADGGAGAAGGAGAGAGVGTGPAAGTPVGGGDLASASATRAWHEVLGVPADASRARILAAYRELVMREHPDPRVAISAEQRARAEARLQEIEAACNAGLATGRP